MMDPQVRMKLEHQRQQFENIAKANRRSALTYQNDAERLRQQAREADRTAEIADGVVAELDKLLSA